MKKYNRSNFFNSMITKNGESKTKIVTKTSDILSDRSDNKYSINCPCGLKWASFSDGPGDYNFLCNDKFATLIHYHEPATWWGKYNEEEEISIKKSVVIVHMCSCGIPIHISTRIQTPDMEYLHYEFESEEIEYMFEDK